MERLGWCRSCVLAMASLLFSAFPADAEEGGVAGAEAASDRVEIAPPPIATSLFAARSPFRTTPRLSPDGKRILYSLEEGDKTYIGVFDLERDGQVGKWQLGEGHELEWHRWAGNGKILFSVSVPGNFMGIPVRGSRLLAADVDANVGWQVGNQLGFGGEQVVHVDPEGEYVLLSQRKSIFDDPQVWRFALDSRDTKGERIESRRGVTYWATDETGVVRLGLGYENRRLKVWYRKDAGERMRLIAKLRDGDKDELWDAVRIISGSDEGYVLEPGPSGRIALRRFNYATREVGEVVYENPEWDLTDFSLDDDGKPYSVNFTDHTDRVVWLDEDLAKLQRGFEQALGADDVWIVEVSRDNSRMIVWQGGSNDPGTLFTYTRATRELGPIAQIRPDLDPALLALARPIEYAARDGTRIRGYLTLPRGREARNLPLVVLPHGGPYGIRDKLDYHDEVQLLANRGYAVLQPNFRGSGGYGEEFENLGNGEIGRRMQDDLDDAVDWAAAEGIADPRRVCLVGSSYGGYAALWGAIRNPERYRCAASFAGVTEWDRQLKYDRSYLDRSSRREWRDQIRGEDRKFDMDTVSPARQAARLQRPVLLVHGKKDGRVPFEQFELMRKAIERAGVEGAEFLVLEKSGHNFVGAEDEQAWYDALVAFLARHNPAD